MRGSSELQECAVDSWWKIYYSYSHTWTQIRLNPTRVFLESKGTTWTSSSRALKWAPTWYVCRMTPLWCCYYKCCFTLSPLAWHPLSPLPETSFLDGPYVFSSVAQRLAWFRHGQFYYYFATLKSNVPIRYLSHFSHLCNLLCQHPSSLRTLIH